MKELYSTPKERRGRKTEISVNLKNNTSFKIKITSKRDRFSETERFIEL